MKTTVASGKHWKRSEMHSGLIAYRVAPVETSIAVKSALIQIVSATDPASRYGNRWSGWVLQKDHDDTFEDSVPPGYVTRRTMATGTVNDAIGTVGWR